jgi:methylated-DNA-protein-cysteine methyltransferase-like protein
VGPPLTRKLRAIRRSRDDIRNRPPGGARERAYAPEVNSAASIRAGRILARIRATPAGFVRTYGDVSPGAPRFAGAVLSACEDSSVPWHRIVRADGTLTQGRRQRHLLEREGVPFRGERVQLSVARLPEGL